MWLALLAGGPWLTEESMGREIRMVPPNWEHPMTRDEYSGRMRKQPMHRGTYAEARAEWLDGLRKWEAGEDPDREKYKNDDGSYQDWWEWNGGPPDRAYYETWERNEATWFQLWETVSEGSPVTPPFSTKEELAQYLASHGDEWDQQRCLNRDDCRLFGMEYGKPGWGIERAHAFVNAGWAPSMVVTNGKVLESKDVPFAMKSEGG